MAGSKLVKIMQDMAKVPSNSATDLLFGKVLSVSPLKIRVDNRFEITSNYIILTSLVQDFNVDMVIDGTTKSCKVKLGLNVGETVLLLRTQDGQKYIIIDRKR